MRLKNRPNSAQPTKNTSSVQHQSGGGLNLPNRTMSVNVRSPAALAAQESILSNRPYGSLSQSYMSPGVRQRPPINPELHKLQQQQDWASECILIVAV